MRLALILALVLAPLGAWGQARLPPPQINLAPRLNLGVSMIGGPYSSGTNAGFCGTGGSGHTCAILWEIPDDAYAFQLVASNENDSGAAAAWTLTTPVLAASSSYGAVNNVGTAALDQWGNAVTSALPFQFANGGANTQPIAGLAGQTAIGIPSQVMALPTSGSTAAGSATLTFSSTFDPRAYGGTNIAAVGWFVADGLGCIAPGVTVASINATQITLTGNAGAAVGCLSGQSIYLSPAPFGAFSKVVPALPANGPIPVVYSDWMPLQTLARVDGGFATGNVLTVTGTNIPANTALTSITPISLILSQPISGTVAAKAQITLSVNQTAATVLDGFRFTLGDTRGVKVGQSVSGTGVQAGSVVTGVTAGVVTITQAVPTASTIAQGAALTFSSTIFTTNNSTASGTSLPVNSTSGSRIVILRFFTGPTDTFSLLTLPCGGGRCQQGLGLPFVQPLLGGVGIDGVNVWSNITGTTGAMTPTAIMPNLALRYVTAHRAITTLGCGGYQAMGAGTATQSASALTLASAALSTPSVPVTAINAANTGSTDLWAQRCSEWIKAAQPGIVDLWTYSDHPPSSGQSLTASLYAIEQQVLAYGGKLIHSTDAPEQTTQVGGIFLPAAVNGTVATLTYSSVDFPFGGSGYLVTGPGIPAGTTAAFSAKPATGAVMSPTLTFSQAVAIPANSTIILGYQVASGSSGTTVTLAFPSPLAITGVQYPISGPAGIAAGTTATVALNGTTLTLSQAGTVNAGDTLILSHFDLSAKQITSRNWPQTMGLSGASPVRDNMADYDPANLNFKRTGASFAGTYNSDYGEALWSAREKTLIQPLLGN